MNSKIKLQLYKILNFRQPFENSIKKSLISAYSELIEFSNIIENKTKFFYLDNEAIYNILYNEEKIIKIETKKYEYSFIYYLSLLIKEKKEIINFDFGIDFIKEIDSENDDQENELKKLFVSKIILDFIFNYKGAKETEDEGENEDKKLNEIREKNKKYITDNINNVFSNDLKLGNIEEISITKLYLNIIIDLIKNKKLENYDFEYDILNKLDLENIDINQNIFNELKNILDDKRYINDYKINDIGDFFVETKINFYYILIKYIFKNSFFIYNISLLYNTRNTIIKIIKAKKREFCSYFNKENIDFLKKINFILKFILDSNYYYKIFIDIISQFDYFNDKNNKDFLINLIGEENYGFTENLEDNSTKKSELIKNIENKNLYEEELVNQILKKSEVFLNTKKEGEKLIFIFESISYGDHHIFISYEKLQQFKEFFINNRIESIIAKSFIKYMDFLEEFKIRIGEEFRLGYNLKIILEFQIIDKTYNDSIYNVDCFYKFYSPNLDYSSNLDISTFNEKNVLINKINSENQGFLYLICEINNEKFEGIKFQERFETETKKISNNNNVNPNSNKFFDETLELNLNSFSKTKEITDFDLKMVASKYQIAKIIGIIGEHKNTAEFIMELSNGYYVSGGTDNILKIYGKDFKKLNEIKDIKDLIYSCFERKKNLFDNNDYDTELIVCCNELLDKICLSFKEEIKYKHYRYSMKDFKFKSCILIKENNSVFIGYNSSYIENFFISQTSKIKKNIIASEIAYLGSIKINENLIVMTSNKVHDYGEDKLIFYNTDKKTISREIEGYSFTYGINGLVLIPREEVKCKNKILLCACKKYIDGQKNGIYLANPQLEDRQLVNNPFYETGNFEVHCFCPILIINPDNDILEIGKEKKIIDTEYFFVGGFNVDKSEGEIKLFKVIYSEKASNNKIEFVQDIEFERNEKFNGFDAAVSSIIQTKKDNEGYILVTCYSGKVYLLTKPNLDYYLEIK